MSNKLLLIVDPQIDFISGTLPVPKAAEAMDALAAYIKEHADAYTATVITMDWHPFDHSSFTDNGGIWPMHCVAYSTGAAVYDSVLIAANTYCKNLTLLTKGTDRDEEEYSIFQNPHSSEILKGIISDLEIKEIDVCGLAGDICVRNTAIDASNLYGEERVKILQQYSPTIAFKQEIMDKPILNEHNKQEYPPMHSAEHLLNGEMARRYGRGRAFSSHIERKKSKLDYHLPKPLSKAEIQSLEDYINSAVKADVEVTEEYISQEEAMKRFDLSRLPEDASETVRIVHIGDYDECLCAGTHVGRTSEIGTFRISSTRYEDGVQRIVFRLDP